MFSLVSKIRIFKKQLSESPTKHVKKSKVSHLLRIEIKQTILPSKLLRLNCMNRQSCCPSAIDSTKSKLWKKAGHGLLKYHNVAHATRPATIQKQTHPQPHFLHSHLTPFNFFTFLLDLVNSITHLFHLTHINQFITMAPPHPPRITILGSLNIDLVSYVPHHPLPGETLTSNHFTTSPGGKGANQAVACGKLSRSSDLSSASASAHVSMIGAVGADSYGSVLRDSLRSYGVDVAGVAVRESEKTGIAIIVVDEPSGQNRIILSPEANHSLRPAEFQSLPDPRPDLLIMQLEIPFDTVMQALRAAKAAGVPVLLNPAPAQELPAEAYDGLAHLVVNETEAALLAGCSESDLDDLTGLQRVGNLFLERGVQNVIITLGGRGVYFVNKAGKGALLPANKTTVVDTTAAGDTFVGSYALAAVGAGGKEFDIEDAVAVANRASAKTVARKGAQISIPWKDELQ